MGNDQSKKLELTIESHRTQGNAQESETPAQSRSEEKKFELTIDSNRSKENNVLEGVTPA